MLVNTERTRALLQSFEFKALFIEEFGWDRYTTTLDVFIDGQNYALSAIAEKRGMVVFVCETFVDGGAPDYPTRRKIDRQVAKAHHEHLIIYLSADRSMQIWQWVKRQAGKPAACREHTYYITQPGDALIQKIGHLAFSLEEEEDLTIVEVGRRARTSFDVEKITKRFYDRFKTEHGKFLKFLKGIPEEKFQRWYVSVMLNRLMFIYFIQKKSFLGNDTDYLRSRLEQSKERGRDRYYKSFLCPLFFEGFARKEDERSIEMNQLLGKVPYLDGGLFQEHQVEKLYGKEIQIADAAFDNLFAFFEQYQWYQDERPLRADNEINPDVLGYIFEKYINQKQMGAYYTKEDITGYISKNTIIPFIFDQAQKKCRIAFEGDQSVWRLFKEGPDRYIYDAVKKGVELSLPEEVEVGIEDVSKRNEWNKPAPPKYALPTEIWREVVTRRQRYQEVLDKMLNGEITSINDLITYNLGIRQFAQDVIENCEGPELLRAFYHTIAGRIPDKSNQEFHPGISVLDPTCGSGAFLFAALNILEPLYEACLDRMQVFLDELESSGQKHRSDKFVDFRRILERIEQHPNRRYFVLKSIILNNLYGVDIMEEAIEICKLRLFLKLVAQIDKIEDIEPLPDIDFNIRAGNTLVGFASHDEVNEAITTSEAGKQKQEKLQFGEYVETLKKLEEKAQGVENLFKLFRQQQTELGGVVTSSDKEALINRLKELEDELDCYLAFEYGINRSKIRDVNEYEKRFIQWLKNHQPFHWFIEFHGIMNEGGFNVIIGNPPYVEYGKIKRDYVLPVGIYKTELSGNLYAFVIERSYLLAKNEGRFGMIVPISLICTQRMSILQDLILSGASHMWNSIYAERPSKLFSGTEVLLSISLSKLGKEKNGNSFITGLRKWSRDERDNLFETTSYCQMEKKIRSYIFPKVSNEIEHKIIAKLWHGNKRIGSYFCKPSEHVIYYRIGGGRYWKVFTTFQPRFKLNGKDSVSSRENYLYFRSQGHRDLALAVFSSTLFYWYFLLTTNGRDLNPSDLSEFPIDLEEIGHSIRNRMYQLVKILIQNYKQNKLVKEKISKLTGHIEYEEFYPRKAKRIIDEIDDALVEHYGFTEGERYFIINYDIKYRMGLI
jgi:type I restriction-modification system DNA methylase subunit/uncharacterized protein YlzI (FlbEa/FlbD family)